MTTEMSRVFVARLKIWQKPRGLGLVRVDLLHTEVLLQLAHSHFEVMNTQSASQTWKISFSKC